MAYKKDTNDDGCSVRKYTESKLYSIINKNRYNYTGDGKYSCSHCKTFSQLDGSYISLIDEDQFLIDPDKYIENAYNKSKDISNFNISKLR
ncbi:hypothetical protein C7S15_4354 [Burkholderia cepacia]|nr:hypothetical protein [Burkholderia cepacia]